MNCYKCFLAAATLLVTATSVTAGEPIRLTTDGTNKRDPVFTDGGKNLIYCYDETTALIRMVRMSIDDRKVVPVFDDAGDKHHLEPAFSPNGRYVCYTQCTGNLTARLVIRDLQENKAAYINHSGRGGTRSPAFSPTIN